jgi:hypothetical protein
VLPDSRSRETQRNGGRLEPIQQTQVHDDQKRGKSVGGRIPSVSLPSLGRSSLGFTAIGVLLLFGATMAGLAAATLLHPGTLLDDAWQLNPSAYRQLSPIGSKVGILFALLSAALVVSGIGWFRHRRWGWRLAVAIIATQVLGDIINLVRGDWLRGGIGVVIAGALLLYLLTPRLRAKFSNDLPAHHSERTH